MKLIIIIMTTFLLQVSASTYGQYITLKKDNISLKSAFNEIRKQTGYTVLSRSGQLNNTKPIKVNLVNVPLVEALRKILAGQDLEFSIEDKAIIIKSKEKGFLDNLIARFQAINVRGKILDEKGQPLVGATVAIKGKNRSVKTDQNGAFYLQNVGEKDKLVISFIGYQSREVDVASDMGSLTMMITDAKLEEVIVNAGYYTVKGKERTGSIARITSKDIETQPVSNVLASMQGRMAGVNVTQTTGVPGGGFEVQIRGLNSLRASGNSPLYIIDGVPYSSQAIGNGQTSTILPASSSPLNSINPGDIESIEVLKDADATAIYGSRGANGVVLITSKKGRAGATTYKASVSSGFGSVTRFMDLMNTKQYLFMRAEAFQNNSITEYPENAYDINGAWDSNRYTDWQKELIGGTATISDVAVSASGGSEQTQFMLGGNFRKETTVFPGDFAYKKGNLRLSLNHESLDKRFHMTFSAGYTTQDNNQPWTDFTSDALRLAPNAPALFKEDGSLNWENSTWENPLRNLEGKFQSNTGDLVANTVLSWNVWDNIVLRSSFGFTDLQHKENRTFPSTMFNPIYGAGSEYSAMYMNNTSRRSYIIEPQIGWNGIWHKLNTEVLAGTTFQEQNNDQIVQSGTGFASNALIYNLAAATYKNILSNDQTQYKYQAVFGRINFNYDSKYILNFTGRRDGSSRFGPRRRYANFGAVGAAWLFSNENFLKESNVLSFGKLRGSYGSSGNDQIGDYQFMDTYTLTGVSYNGLIGLQPSRLFNPDFGWETNSKLEVAVEAGLFKDRVFLTAAWYNNLSSNQLIGVPLPGTTGFTTLQANLGATIQNRGTEFTLRTVNLEKNDLSWTISFNVSMSRNKVLKFPGLENSTYKNQFIIGQPANIRLLYTYTGLNSDIGIYEFKDVDSDGSINAPNDKRYVADFNPEYFGGIQNHISYKGLALDFLFQFVKQKNWNQNYLLGMPGTMVNQSLEALNRWQAQSDKGPYQQFSSGTRADLSTAFANYAESSAAISDASYIRLKNVSLSYTLSDHWLKNVKCKLFLEGQNLLTFTSYKGADPEFRTTGFLPPLKMFTTGIQLAY